MVPSNSLMLEVFSMFCIMLTLFIIYKQIDKKHEVGLWAIPMIMWLLHSLIFYAFVNIERFSGIDVGISFTFWSAILRLHGYMTILFVEFFRFIIQRNRVTVK